VTPSVSVASWALLCQQGRQSDVMLHGPDLSRSLFQDASSKRGGHIVFAVGIAPSSRPETLFRKTSQIFDASAWVFSWSSCSCASSYFSWTTLL
jgi:hypothetical protein